MQRAVRRDEAAAIARPASINSLATTMSTSPTPGDERQHRLPAAELVLAAPAKISM